jgi:hypothetical protein
MFLTHIDDKRISDMRAHSKKSWRAVGHYFQKAIDMYAQRGIVLNIEKAFDVNDVGSRFHANGDAMTDAGHMEISVYDWVHMQFALTDEAKKLIYSISTPSGKWNHHPDPHAIDNAEYVTAFLSGIGSELDRIGARKWEVKEQLIRLADVPNKPMEEWLREQKMGVRYYIEDFDKVAVATRINEECSKDTSPNLRALYLEMLLEKSDLQVLASQQNWDAYKIQHLAEFKDEAPAAIPN